AQPEARWLEEAGRLTERVLSHFWDTELGGFFFTGDEHEPLIARPVTFNDLPIPSGSAAMAQNLLTLGRWLSRPVWVEKAQQTIEWFGHSMTHSPQAFSAMYLALDMLFHPEA
ncbi:MAG: thioredoxin domain-containing protein, partial [Anaerolineae bacterium]